MSSAADLVRETKASIAEAQAAVASLTAERAGLALAAARGDRGAAAKSAKLRERIAAASDRIEDLTGLLPDLAGYVRLEEAAADHGADRERRRRARHIAEAHVRAAQAVDEAVAALAVAMQVATEQRRWRT